LGTAVTFLCGIPDVPDSNLGWNPDWHVLWLSYIPQLNCWDSTGTVRINAVLNHTDLILAIYRRYKQIKYIWYFVDRVSLCIVVT
jgi:hypothetical protein